MSLLDDAFELLEIAHRLEKTGVNRIEAATKVSFDLFLVISKLVEGYDMMMKDEDYFVVSPPLGSSS